jgi:hypothetical protein
MHAIPITPNQENFNEYINNLLDGKEYQFPKPVTGIPTGLKNWLSKNQDTIERMKSKPYFIADNFKSVKQDGEFVLK